MLSRVRFLFCCDSQEMKIRIFFSRAPVKMWNWISRKDLTLRSLSVARSFISRELGVLRNELGSFAVFFKAEDRFQGAIKYGDLWLFSTLMCIMIPAATAFEMTWDCRERKCKSIPFGSDFQGCFNYIPIWPWNIKYNAVETPPYKYKRLLLFSWPEYLLQEA